MFREKLYEESLYPEEGITEILFFVSGQMSLWPVQGRGGEGGRGIKLGFYGLKLQLTFSNNSSLQEKPLPGQTLDELQLNTFCPFFLQGAHTLMNTTNLRIIGLQLFHLSLRLQ